MKNTRDEWTLWYKDPELDKKRPFRVRTIMPGYRDIAVDRLGRVYMKRWNSGEELKNTSTPRHRAIICWDKRKIEWRRYEHGIVELARGMKGAVLKGKKEIPQWERIQKLCDDNSLRMFELSSLTAQERKNIRRQLARAIMATEGRQRKELKEVREQLSFVLPLRDSAGRINVMVLQMRLKAASVRLLERIQGISSWRPKYAMRLTVAEDLRDQGFSMVKRVSDHNKARNRHAIIAKGKFEGQQTNYFCRQIDNDLAELKHCKGLRPFRGWCTQTAKDLKKLQEAVQKGNVKAAKKLTEQIHQSSQLKLLQLELYDMLEEFSVALALKKPIPTVRMKKRIERLGNQIRAIDDKGWKYPVVKDIIHYLRVSYKHLSKRKFKESKEALREASRLF